MPDILYLVGKLHEWSDFSVTVNGVVQPLWQPRGTKIIGFLPVYSSHEEAVAESCDQDIITIAVNDVLTQEGGSSDTKED